MTALIRSNVPRLAAEVNWSRWICRCPRCPSALAMRPGDPLFECWECGAAAEVVWPPEGLVASIEQVLMMRPDPISRSWLPGETLYDLMVENAANGLLDHLPPGPVMLADEDAGIVTHRLPTGREFPRAIGA